MAIIDAHSVYDATGSTTLVYENNANAVIPAGDGATTIGLSPQPNSILFSYGYMTLGTTDAAGKLALQSNNIVDPTNGLQDANTGTSTAFHRGKFAQVSYGNGPNLVGYNTQTAAAKVATYKMDWNTRLGTSVAGSFFPPGFAEYTFSGSAATAGVYETIAFNPGNAVPTGKYAILGLRVYSLTSGAFLRFQHTDFGGAFPGIPIFPSATGSSTAANMGFSPFASESWQGCQFVKLSQYLGQPSCPVFTVQGQGTGLNLQFLSTNTDTPQFDLNLMKVG